MKLNLNFNGIQATPSVISAAINAAGGNSRFSINGAHSISSSNLSSIINAAGNTKQLTLNFNGAQASLPLIQGAASSIGDASLVEINTAHSLGITQLTAIANSAGSKKLAVDFNGGQSSATLIQQFLGLAGVNTTTSVNTAQAFSEAEITAIANSAGSKPYRPTFNGGQLSLAKLQAIVNAAGSNTMIGVNTAQSFGSSNWTSILSTIGNKFLSADFDGDKGPTARALQILRHSSPNTSVSINTAQSLGTSNLNSILNAAGNKQLSLTFNGTYTSVALLQQALNLAAANTTIMCINFQDFSANDALSILASVGNKNFFAIIDGASTAQPFVTSVINAAGANTTVVIDPAHAFNQSQLISFIQAAG